MVLQLPTVSGNRKLTLIFPDLLSRQEWANKLKPKLIFIGIKFIPSKFVYKDGKSHLLERNEAKHSISNPMSFLASQNKRRHALSEPNSLKIRNR